MRTPRSAILSGLRRDNLGPHSNLSLVSWFLIAVLAWAIYEVWDATYVPTNQELRKAYQQGFNAALDTKRVKPELEGACLNLWWGQNEPGTN